MKHVSNKHFQKRTVHDDKHELEIDIVPTLRFRKQPDAFGGERAYEVRYIFSHQKWKWLALEFFEDWLDLSSN